MTIAAIAAAIMVSCEQKINQECGLGSEGSLSPICMTTGIGSFGYDISTRSGLESMKEQGFGFLGYNTGDDRFDPENPSGLVFDNYRMTSEDGSNWDYTGKTAYWNRSTTEKYTFLAYHPYDEAQSSAVLDVPAGDKINDCKDLMAAAPVINRTTRGEVMLAFRHIFSKINTTVSLTDEYPGQEYTLKKITFSGVKEYKSYLLAKNDFDRSSVITHEISSEETNIKNATLAAVEDKIIIDPIYVSPYGYAASGGNIAVNFEFDYEFTDPSGMKETQSFTKEIVLSEDFQANHEYNLSVVFVPDEKGVVDMSVTVDDYSAKTGVDIVIEQSPDFNLSKHGTANCYIVPNAGRYHFDGTHRGNSPTEEVGDVASVEVLWESFGTDEAVSEGDLISDLVYDYGSICFTASDKKGNALIAAKDSEGKILWSWHIWLTDKPLDQIYNNDAGISMDRNLGATSALKEDGVKTYGLLYQWGRKDPFMNAGALTGNVPAVNTGEWPVNAVLMQSADWVNANPMTYICRPNSTALWMEVADPYRWKTLLGGKSVNDPCPPGYMVPSGAEESGFYHTAAGGFAGARPTFDGGYDFGNSDSKLSFTSEPLCWFPATSSKMIVNDGKLDSERKGVYWMNEMYTTNDNTSYVFAFNKELKISMDCYGMSNAYSVRCVKE